MITIARSSRRPAGLRTRAATILALAAGLTALAAGPAAADRIKNPTAVFDGLDKITGRIISFEVSINETVQFGSLQVTPRACYTRPPTEAPQTDTFVEIDEVSGKTDYKRIFGGWMFAASPGLHALEHPIYDVWLIDCKGGDPEKDLVRLPSDATETADAPPAAVEPAPAPATAQPQLPSPPPPKPGTVPRPRRQAVVPDTGGVLAGPPVPGGGAPTVTAQPLPPPPPRQPPAQRFFPADVVPPSNDVDQ